LAKKSLNEKPSIDNLPQEKQQNKQLHGSTDKDIVIHELLDQLQIEQHKNQKLQTIIENQEVKWQQDRNETQKQIDSLSHNNKKLQTIIENQEVKWQQDQQQWQQDRQQWQQDRQQWQQDHDKTQKQMDHLNKKVEDLVIQLKIAMKIIPSSERGKGLNTPEAAVSDNKNTGSDGNGGDDSNNEGPGPKPEPTPKESHHEMRYRLAIARPRAELPQGLQLSDSLQQWLLDIKSDRELIPAPAKIFGTQIISLIEKTQDFSFTAEERQKLFGTNRGLHSKKETSIVYDFEMLIQQINCQREVLTDLTTGLRHSKDKSLAPKGSRLSWAALAKITTLVAEYAFPMERLSTAIGIPYFSSANISRWFAKSAKNMVHPYIAMGKSLGEMSYLKTDDTSTLVLQLRTEAKKGLTPDCQMSGDKWGKYIDERAAGVGKSSVDLVTDVIEAFGRVSQTVSGEKAKTSLNTTVISGRLNRYDYSSTVYFYRTHFGQAGNLLSRILEYRSQKNLAPIVIQGDLSSQNHIESAVAAHFSINYIGCASHSRRPFYRYRDRDKQLCFFMLRCFAILARVELMIKHGQMKQERVLRLRRSYSTKVWRIMESVCRSVLAGEHHPLADNNLWKKRDKIYAACAYIVKHIKELTYYLDHPEIDPDNNSSEQCLRGEKLIENAAYFRQSENGRIALDIHRTMIACCNVCKLSYETYLRYISNAEEAKIASHPEQFTPYAVAQALSSRDPPKSTDLTFSESETILH
jgi:hypothetical protein